jgi:hypothetical protein
MAAFDPGDDAEEMPESKWADGFQRSADAGWWSKGDHVSLGKDLVRSSLRALVPDLEPVGLVPRVPAPRTVLVR